MEFYYFVGDLKFFLGELYKYDTSTYISKEKKNHKFLASGHENQYKTNTLEQLDIDSFCSVSLPQ